MQNVVYTSGDTRWPWWVKYTRRMISDYANVTGAKFVNLPKNPHSRYWVSIDAIRLSIEHEKRHPGSRYVWLDSDILFEPVHTPNLFKMGPGMWVCRHDKRGYRARSYQKWRKAYHVPASASYPCTAVVVWDAPAARKIIRACDSIGNIPQTAGRLNDEDALAVFAHHAKLRFRDLPGGWHNMLGAFTSSTLFYHASGRNKWPNKVRKANQYLTARRRARRQNIANERKIAEREANGGS